MAKSTLNLFLEDRRGMGSACEVRYPIKPRQMKFKCTFSPTITDTFKKRGWIESDEYASDWDIYFCDMIQMRDIFSFSSRPLEDHQRIGHFRNNFEISRKNFMVRNLKRLKARIERAFGSEEGKKCHFFPTTFVLPLEQKWFMQEFRCKPSSYWIIKPAAGAQGRGIFIFRNIKDFYEWRAKFESSLKAAQQEKMSQNSPPQPKTYQDYVIDRLQMNADDVTKDQLDHSDQKDEHGEPKDDQLSPPGLSPPDGTSEPELIPSMDDLLSLDIGKEEGNKNDIYVVQQYITNPYLIGGRKFDIRFFILVTSFLPLKAWMYRDGFARFSQGQFSLESLQDIYVHLTNVAIQRTAEDYNPEKGSKWSIRDLRQYLTARHGRRDVQELMNLIDNIVVRTLQSVHHAIIQDSHCFEIYGFDVLIDDTLTPWLLEVNCSPSFTPSNEEDYKLKSGIIDDTISILDLENRLTGFEKRVGGYDLIWDDGPVYANPADSCHAEGWDGGRKLNSYLGCLNDRNTQLRHIYTDARYIRTAQKASKDSLANMAQAVYSVNSSRSSGKSLDDKFPMPATILRDAPSYIPLVQPRSSNNVPRYYFQAPLMVLGKAVESKHNVSPPKRRTSEYKRHIPI